MTSAHQRVKIPFADPALQTDIDTHADQFGALFRQSVYLPGGHEHGIPCFSGKNGGGDYGGNPNGNNRHAKRFLRDLKPVVSHAGTGHDTGGGKLNGGAEALCACGGKRVHRNDARRLYNGRYTLYDLRASMPVSPSTPVHTQETVFRSSSPISFLSFRERWRVEKI